MENKKIIKCKYIFDDKFNPLYANGAQGGISVLGEILINFYLERTALPNSQTFEIDPNSGVLGQELKSEMDPLDLESSTVRFMQTGVILNYSTAKEIHRWLGDHLKTLEKINLTQNANKNS